MHNDQKRNIPKLPTLPTLKLDVPIPYDPSESGSITDRVIRKEKEIIDGRITIKEYGEPIDPPYTIKRFAITPHKDLINKQITTGALHEIEKVAFKKAAEELKDLSTSTVLVDIFVRNEGKNKAKIVIKEDPKSLHPEIHTICLWKNDNDIVTIIDPSNTARISYFREIIKDIFDKVEIQYHNNSSKDNDKPKKTNDKPKQIIDDKFYDSGPIVPIGKNDGEARDCIDIAVKIAFVINEVVKSADHKLLLEIKEHSANLSTDYKEKISNNIDENIKSLITDNIKKLSNQYSLNKIIGDANNGTLIRELQSSDPNIRKEVLDLFENNIKPEDSTKLKKDVSVKDNPTRFIVVNKLNELQKLNELRELPDSILSKADKSIKLINTNKVFLSQIEHLKELYNQIETFNKQHFSELNKDFPELIHFPSHTLKLSLISTANSNDATEGDKYFESLSLAIKEQDVNQVNHVLASFKTKELLEDCLRKVDEKGQTVLHWAAGVGYTDIAQTLVKNMNPEDIALPARENNNYTSLHMAVHSNNHKIVEYLLQRNSEESFVNAQDSNGQTALHWATDRGYAEIVKTLVENMTSEDIGLQTARGTTVLHLALSKKHEIIDESLEQIIETLINKMSAEDISKDVGGLTALHCALLNNGYENIAELLINKMNPEDLGKQNIRGYTPLHIVLNKTYFSKTAQDKEKGKEIAKLLINKMNPEDFGKQDSNGYTALSFALLDDKEIVELLINRMNPEDLNKRDSQGHTALEFMIIDMGPKEIIESLINRMNPEDLNKDQQNYYRTAFIHHKNLFNELQELITVKTSMCSEETDESIFDIIVEPTSNELNNDLAAAGVETNTNEITY